MDPLWRCIATEPVRHQNLDNTLSFLVPGRNGNGILRYVCHYQNNSCPSFAISSLVKSIARICRERLAWRCPKSSCTVAFLLIMQHTQCSMYCFTSKVTLSQFISVVESSVSGLSPGNPSCYTVHAGHQSGGLMALQAGGSRSGEIH